MQITRSSIDTRKGPADWFTGDVYIDAVAAPAGSSTFAAAAVHFTPGARTAWHTHPHGQPGLKESSQHRVIGERTVASEGTP